MVSSTFEQLFYLTGSSFSSAQSDTGVVTSPEKQVPFGVSDSAVRSSSECKSLVHPDTTYTPLAHASYTKPTVIGLEVCSL